MNLVRAFRKVVVDPFRYGFAGYDAERFWHDRHAKYGLALRGSGNEAWSEQQNHDQNLSDCVRLLSLLRSDCGVTLGGRRVLDVGCGCGVYANACQDAEVLSYVGVDITDALLPALAQAHPGFRFVKTDCTKPGRFGGEFDVVLAVSIIEHITERHKLAVALDNMRAALADHGVLLVGPVYAKAKARLFYHHTWTEADVSAGFSVCGRVPFRGGQMLALRIKPL